MPGVVVRESSYWVSVRRLSRCSRPELVAGRTGVSACFLSSIDDRKLHPFRLRALIVGAIIARVAVVAGIEARRVTFGGNTLKVIPRIKHQGLRLSVEDGEGAGPKGVERLVGAVLRLRARGVAVRTRNPEVSDDLQATERFVLEEIGRVHHPILVVICTKGEDVRQR